MADFKVDTEERSGVFRVRLSGELDLGAFDELDALVATAQMNGNRGVRIDLRGLEFIDLSGVRLLIRANARAQERGKEFFIVRGSEKIQRIFSLTQLDGQLPFCDDEDT